MRNLLKIAVAAGLAVTTIPACPIDPINYDSGWVTKKVEMPISVSVTVRGDCNGAPDGGACKKGACYNEIKLPFEATYDLKVVSDAANSLANSMKQSGTTSIEASAAGKGPIKAVKAEAEAKFATKSSTEASNVANTATKAAQEEAAKLGKGIEATAPCGRRVVETVNGTLHVTILARLTINITGDDSNPVTAVSYETRTAVTFSKKDSPSKTEYLGCFCFKKKAGDTPPSHVATSHPWYKDWEKRNPKSTGGHGSVSPKKPKKVAVRPADLPKTTKKIYVNDDLKSLGASADVVVLDKKEGEGPEALIAIVGGAAAISSTGYGIYQILKRDGKSAAAPNVAGSTEGIKKLTGDPVAYKLGSNGAKDPIFRATGKGPSGAMEHAEGKAILETADRKKIVDFPGADKFRTIETVETVDGQTGEVVKKEETPTWSDSLELKQKTYTKGTPLSGQYSIEFSSGVKGVQAEFEAPNFSPPKYTETVTAPGTFPLEKTGMTATKTGGSAVSLRTVPILN